MYYIFASFFGNTLSAYISPTNFLTNQQIYLSKKSKASSEEPM